MTELTGQLWNSRYVLIEAWVIFVVLGPWGIGAWSNLAGDHLSGSGGCSLSRRTHAMDAI